MKIQRRLISPKALTSLGLPGTQGSFSIAEAGQENYAA